MLLLASNIHGKTSQKVKTDDILKACVCYLQICTHVSILHLCYNFALVLHENALALHENALAFSQSEVCNFFIYVITFVAQIVTCRFLLGDLMYS